jgi:DUF4097 and DUF4098 domain-containing protein YvlB
MMKIKIKQNWEFSDLKTLEIENEMAPLAIEANSENNVILEGELSLTQAEEDFDIKDYVRAEFADGKLELRLEEIDAFDHKAKNSTLKLKVPEDVFVKIEIENLPLSMSGLKNNIRIISENAPVSVKNCTGDKHLESENGPVRIHNSAGSIFAKLENGPISAEDICGEGLHLESENGPIKLRLASFSKVDVETENGPIYYETQPVEGGDFKFKTENGIVHLVLPLSFSFSLEAESERGRLKSKLDAEVSHEDNTFRIENVFEGEKPTQIKIETENGLIKLSSDGQININYIKEKLDQLKETLINVNTMEELEKATDKLNQMVDYLHRAAQSINEEKIKTKVIEAIENMKDMARDFDLDTTKTVIIGKIEGLSSEIYDGIKEGMRNVKAEFDDLKYEHLNSDSLKEYINKVVNSPLIKPYLGAEKKKAEKEEIAERSRLKILDMLESGKITSEEAEKLLKAIGKE